MPCKAYLTIDSPGALTPDKFPLFPAFVYNDFGKAYNSVYTTFGINRVTVPFLQGINRGLIGVPPLLTPCYTPANPL